MHSPTLVILASIQAALVTAVLFAVWYFNRGIPGLRAWTLSFLGASVFCVVLLVRNRVPELAAVLAAQGSLAVAALGFLQGSRAYMGRGPLHNGAWLAVVVLLALSAFFTVVQPHPGARFALTSLFSGICFLLTAYTLAQGGFRVGPVRYLVAGVIALHGAFVLLRPALFKLPATWAGSDLLPLVSQFVMLESVLALMLIGFGVLMLTTEFSTRELKQLAEVDPLTSAFNRRAFLTLLDKAISHAQRAHSPLPVLVIDLDYFKKINDTWGHLGGDEVLRHFVWLAHRCLRHEDVMGRLGGEEFAIFLPGAELAGAAAVAERLRTLVAAQPAPGTGDRQRGIPLTVSIGVALYAEGDHAGAVLQRADEAMYRAKQGGRNRVEVWAGAGGAPGAVGASAAKAA